MIHLPRIRRLAGAALRVVLLASAILLYAPTAAAGLFVDHWVPAAGTCPSDADALRRAVRAAQWDCRVTATVLDPLGTPSVRPLAYATCMRDAGWMRTMRSCKRAWLARCSGEQHDLLSGVVGEETPVYRAVARPRAELGLNRWSGSERLVRPWMEVTPRQPGDHACPQTR